MFHILSHTEGEGGATQLVDGFRAAEILSRTDIGAIDMLTRVQMMAHASGNDGISIQPNAPFSVLRYSTTGNLEQVRWNNADRGAFVPDVLYAVKGWYKAARYGWQWSCEGTSHINISQEMEHSDQHASKRRTL